MRALLAPLSRWLDRRIDGRIAVELERRRQVDTAVMTKLVHAAAAPSSGLAELTREAAEDIKAVPGIVEAEGRIADRPRDDRWMGA